MDRTGDRASYDGRELTDGTMEGLLPHEFHVHDAGSASWLVRRVVEAREYAKRVRDWAEREQRRAGQEEEFLLFRYGKQLEYWAAGEIERQRGKRRSIGLPGGTVGFRKVGALLVIEDEAAVLAWARRHLVEAVVVTEKVSKSTLNEHLKETGELPPVGIRITEPFDRFYIK
ncbi:MAG: host-nuclease inhibitor Gam family protein [Phycisphaeraceae bacterium]